LQKQFLVAAWSLERLARRRSPSVLLLRAKKLHRPMIPIVSHARAALAYGRDDATAHCHFDMNEYAIAEN
jgi:hypothetical protein